MTHLHSLTFNIQLMQQSLKVERSMWNVESHEARRAGSCLAQAARPGYRCDGMSAACRAALAFNFSCISPALQAGGIFTCRFPRALPWAKASRAFGAGSWSQHAPEIGGPSFP